jgi:membrane fusion protein (multidrug efflux system)
VNSPTSTPGSARRRGLSTLAVIVVIGVLAAAAYWTLHGRNVEHTNDAYVAADLVPISSEVAGTVSAIHVDDTQQVERGQLLVELDRADAEVAMAAAEADLARAVRRVRGSFAQVEGLKAQVEAQRLQLTTARADLSRRQAVTKGAVSAEELAHARDQVARLQSALIAAEQSLATAQAQTEGTDVQTHPDVLRAATAVREAALALDRTRIVAPVSGVVARRGVQLGARIAPGAPLMAVVPLDRVWVDANFKEVQLEHLRIGQPVALHADMYGSDVEFSGHVSGLGAGSGAAFALLPAQNASGNWIKIVQRVPVRIALDPAQLAEHPLRVGLSMDVRVDVRDRSGAVMNTAPEAAPRRLPDHSQTVATVDAHIAQIIAANGGAPTRHVQ